MPAPDHFHVVVVGGGPAGSAAAIMLARANLRTVIVERSDYSTARIGETLPPAIRQPLGKLGVWERFRAAGHTESFAIRSAWGGPEQYDNLHICRPYGSGWHVDRVHFDRMMVDAAAEAGAATLIDTRIARLARDALSGWRVTAVQGDRPRSFTASFIVDAAGRSGSRPAALPRFLQVIDRLIGDVRFFACDAEPYTLIESAVHGWWYSAPVPGRRLVVAYMTDADLHSADRTDRNSGWNLRLTETVLTRQRLGQHVLIMDEPKIVSAASLVRQPVYGADWLAAGDAAVAFDPLSGQGIYKAIEGGMRAAEAIIAQRLGSKVAFAEYADWINLQFSNYVEMRNRFYGKERRWHDLPFWTRRSAKMRPFPKSPGYPGRQERRAELMAV